MQFSSIRIKAGLALLFTALSLASSAISLAGAPHSNPGLPTPQCRKPILSPDGGSYIAEIKYVHARVKAADLGQVISSIGQIGQAGIVGGIMENAKQTRCIATAGVIEMVGPSANGAYQLTLRVDGVCSDHEEYAAVGDFESRLMRSLIETLAKLPGLDVDPSWDETPPCVGGGVTGST